MRCLVAGAGGAIGGALVGRLVDEGHTVIALDIKPPAAWWQTHPGAVNCPGVDLRSVTAADLTPLHVEWMFDLAEDKGGAPWITAHNADSLASALIGANALTVAAQAGVHRFFYSSSACVYPMTRLAVPDATPLVEGDAWPARPEGGYGLQKLYMEELCAAASVEWGIETRVARFDTIYGPPCSFADGREKVPAAICRKVAQAVATGGSSIEVIGDGEQTRCFLYVDDCIDATLRLMAGDVPLANVGSDLLITVNELVAIVQQAAGSDLEVVHVAGAEGARGRVLDSTLCRTALGWAPTVSLEDGVGQLYRWVARQVERAA